MFLLLGGWRGDLVLLVCFIIVLKSFGFLSNSEVELQKSQKKKKKTSMGFESSFLPCSRRGC